MKGPRGESCASCAFFEPTLAFYQDAEGRGKCRKRAPETTIGGLTVWPMPHLTEWCGDYEQTQDVDHREPF